jgi:hypothetical protein
MTDLVPVRRALISLSDKSGLDALAAGLAKYGVEIVSTGGTAAKLREAGAQVRDISDLTGFPEMMDGRVKTLHPKVHGGLLGVRDNPEHVAAMEEHEIAPIDLVLVNLYPFLNTVMSGADRDTVIENIDIGGPSMVRSAAKNHAHVAIVTDPADYAALLLELDTNGGATTLELRRKLAAKAFALTAEYDSIISQWFAFADQGERWPPKWTLSSSLKMPLRYGENPHQSAALYLPVGPTAHGVAQAEQVQGKELSYNNLNDANAALELAAEFREGPPTIVIVKHANPCGVATRDNLLDAWKEALACDSVSAFGGIVRDIDAEGRLLDALPQLFRKRGIFRGQRDSRWQTFCDLVRESRTREHSNLRTGASFLRNLVQELTALLLDAFRAEQERFLAIAGALEDRAHVLSRCNHKPRVAAVQLGQVRRRADRRTERYAGKEDWVLVAAVHRLDHVALQRPEQGFAAARGSNLCQRRAPGAAPDDSELHAFTPAPRTFSALWSSGQRARAGTSRESRAPTTKRSAPAQAIIAALSVQSHAGGTLKRLPSRLARSASAARIA